MLKRHLVCFVNGSDLFRRQGLKKVGWFHRVKPWMKITQTTWDLDFCCQGGILEQFQ